MAHASSLRRRSHSASAFCTAVRLVMVSSSGFKSNNGWLPTLMNSPHFRIRRMMNQVDSTDFALAWVTLNSSLGWTAENLDALNDFMEGWVWQYRFGS